MATKIKHLKDEEGKFYPYTHESAVLTDDGTKLGDKLTQLDLKVGDLSGLTTTAKTNLVAAINEAATKGGGSTEEIEAAIREAEAAALAANTAAENATTSADTVVAAKDNIVSTLNTIAGSGDVPEAISAQVALNTADVKEVGTKVKIMTGEAVEVNLSTARYNLGNLGTDTIGGPIGENYYQHYVIPIDGAKKVIIEAGEYQVYCILATAYTLPNPPVANSRYENFCPKASNGAQRTINAATTLEIDLIPEDKFLLITKRSSNNGWRDVSPKSIKIVRDATYVSTEVFNEYKVEQDETAAKGYMLPLGVDDNYLADYLDGCGTQKNLNSASSGLDVIIDDLVKRNSDGKIYGLELRRERVGSTGKGEHFRSTCWLCIKRSNRNRYFEIQGQTGGIASFYEDNIMEGMVLNQKNLTNQMGKIVKVDDKYFYLYINMLIGQSVLSKLYCYTDETKSQNDTFDVVRDKCVGLEGDYDSDYINLGQRYYSRSEKLGSKVRGKWAYIVADSLGAFIFPLAYEWGMNIISMSTGGTRMGYEGTDKDNYWIQNDTRVQKVKAENTPHFDFIICAEGSNGTLPETNAQEVEFVLNNKRWYHDSLESDPFASLSESDKERFTSTACTYAFFYSMCHKYEGACAVIAEAYRTPGPSMTGDNWTPKKFSQFVFNGNMLDKQSSMREIARNLGAIYVENKTRDSIAAANAYHVTDGVHPPYQVSVDWASNIATELSRLHDID